MIMNSKHGFQLTLQTVIILVVLLLSLVLILFFFTNVFSTTGTHVAELAGDLNTPTQALRTEEEGLANMENWANPFGKQDVVEEVD